MNRPRPSAPRSASTQAKLLTRAFLAAEAAELGSALEEHADTQRPRTRADCVNGPRPCPWISCRAHLYLDVTAAGSLKLNHPHLEPHELQHSCSLDRADAGMATLAEIGDAMNLSGQQVANIESAALVKLRLRGGL